MSPGVFRTPPIAWFSGASLHVRDPCSGSEAPKLRPGQSRPQTPVVPRQPLAPAGKMVDGDPCDNSAPNS